MQDIAQYLRCLPANCDRQTWIEIGGAFKSAGGDFETFDQWSQTAQEKYNATDCRTAWNSLLPSGNPAGAAGWLRKKAGEAGAAFIDRPEPQTITPPRPAPAPTQVRLSPRSSGGFKSIKPGTPEMED